MSEKEAVKQIDSILDQVYTLEITPMKGINEIAEILSYIKADKGENK